MMFDKRGTGMSDRVAELPGLDERIDDLRAAMDAAGMDQAALIGISEGGPLAALFAATYPDRCDALVLYGSFARFAMFLPKRHLHRFSAMSIRPGAPVEVCRCLRHARNDPAFQRWWGRFERLGASPAAASEVMRMNSQIDISNIVPTVRVPTLVIHRTEDVTVNVEAGRFLAEHIPGARYLELPGKDHIPFVGDNAMEIADAIEEFLTGSRAPVPIDRVLATVLFTDIVGSTEKAAALGDSRWQNLLDNHHATIRRNLARFRGQRLRRQGTAFCDFRRPCARCSLRLRDCGRNTSARDRCSCRAAHWRMRDYG